MRTNARIERRGSVHFGVLLFFALALTAWIIWSFSLEGASESLQRSSAVYRWVESAVNRYTFLQRMLRVTNVSKSQLQEHFRKIAHFVEYFVFGLLTQLFMVSIGRMNGHYAVHGLSIGLAVAVMDELLQTMNDRGPMVQDVALDFVGVVAGSIILLILYGLFRLIARAFSPRRGAR